jgi:hypothetical protein
LWSALADAACAHDRGYGGNPTFEVATRNVWPYGMRRLNVEINDSILRLLYQNFSERLRRQFRCRNAPTSWKSIKELDLIQRVDAINGPEYFDVPISAAQALAKLCREQPTARAADARNGLA